VDAILSLCRAGIPPPTMAEVKLMMTGLFIMGFGGSFVALIVGFNGGMVFGWLWSPTFWLCFGVIMLTGLLYVSYRHSPARCARMGAVAKYEPISYRAIQARMDMFAASVAPLVWLRLGATSIYVWKNQISVNRMLGRQTRLSTNARQFLFYVEVYQVTEPSPTPTHRRPSESEVVQVCGSYAASGGSSSAEGQKVVEGIPVCDGVVHSQV